MVDKVERPISFQSRSRIPAEKQYHCIEGEALAAYWGVSNFWPFPQGTTFTLETDCQALQWLKEQLHPLARLVRWMLKLSNFSFEMKNKAGRKSGNADGLSRLPLHKPCSAPDITDCPLLPYEAFAMKHCCLSEEDKDSESSHERVDYEGRPFSGVATGFAQAQDGPLFRSDQEMRSPPDAHPDAVCCCCHEKGDPSTLLVCEGVSKLAHMHCCDPKLTDVPEENWLCAKCLSEGPETAEAKDITEDASVL